MNPFPITFSALNEEKHSELDLKKTALSNVVLTIAEAREKGDLSENAILIHSINERAKGLTRPTSLSSEGKIPAARVIDPKMVAGQTIDASATVACDRRKRDSNIHL